MTGATVVLLSSRMEKQQSLLVRRAAGRSTRWVGQAATGCREAATRLARSGFFAGWDTAR